MCILSSLFSRKQPAKPEPPPTSAWSDQLSFSAVYDVSSAAWQHIVGLGDHIPALSPREAALAGAAASAVSVALSTSAYRRYFKRIRTAEWLTPDVFKHKRWIKGRVVSVGDADNFRLYHTPGFGWGTLRKVPTAPKDLQKNTIHIRLAGVDAPEGAHFGKIAQEHYQESLQWLRDQVLGKTVRCELYSRDQYMRVVAMPYLPPHFLLRWCKNGVCISTEMLRAGWAVVYEQGGAQYGSYTLEELKKIEEEAKSAKRGIWVSGILKETPAAYKKRLASGVDAAEKGESADVTPEEEAPGWIGRLFSPRR